MLHMFVLEEKSPHATLEMWKYSLTAGFCGAGFQSQCIKQLIVE